MSDQGQPPNSGANASTQGSLFPTMDQEAERGGDEVSERMPRKRKLQVSNGYLLEFDQLSRVMSAIWDNRDRSRIGRATLVETTGLPERHVESLVSMGAAMGLIKSGVQLPTSVGRLVAAHDMFFERAGTLEWCHYCGAGSFRNLVWFDVFHRLLPNEAPMINVEWNDWFRRELAGQYSERTMRKVVQEEVRFVIDAYLEQRLAELGMLEKHADGTLHRNRYLRIESLVFCAMLYDTIEQNAGRISELAELSRMPGSPAVVFGIDAESLRGLVEVLHNNGWLRYETTHNLDQIRLKPEYHSMEFLTAYYEHRDPRPTADHSAARDA